ncbi:MAG: RT0821/Lpp0805 family surface protein [Methylocystis sp.]
MFSLSLSACSMAVPVSTKPNTWSGSAEDITGSIARNRTGKPAMKLSKSLDSEDLRRATAALSTALDPQGSGASVKWENPNSGAKGSFTPSGQAFPLEGKICRAFTGEILTGQEEEKLEGSACREKSDDWALSDVKLAKKG